MTHSKAFRRKERKEEEKRRIEQKFGTEKIFNECPNPIKSTCKQLKQMCIRKCLEEQKSAAQIT